MSAVTAQPGLDAPTILVTGISGNIGRHLAPLLKDFLLAGVDLFSPQVEHPRVDFLQLDLSQPDAPGALERFLREERVRQVVHLAFVLDPARTGAMTRERQREINIGGTAHLLDAIERVNNPQRQVEHLLYLSSVTSYGPMLPGPVTEEYTQQPGPYTYALHKKESEELCLRRQFRLNGCRVTIIRGHIFLGPDVENFITTALRGRPNPRTALGRLIGRLGIRLPLLLPRDENYGGLYQFMHIDDAVRLIAWVCHHPPADELTILNAQGLGPPVTGADVACAGRLPLLRLHNYGFVQFLYRLVWAIGLSAVPPDSFPYFAGSYVMDTRRLEQFLGDDFPKVVRHTARQALESIHPRKE